MAIVIPERDSDAKPSSVRAFNYSNRDVALRLGTQTPAQLAPLANLDNDERPDSGALPIVLAYQEEDRWRLVADTSLALPPGFSAYLFIRSLPRFDLEPNNPQVGYKLIYDRLPVLISPPAATNTPTPAP